MRALLVSTATELTALSSDWDVVDSLVGVDLSAYDVVAIEVASAADVVLVGDALVGKSVIALVHDAAGARLAVRAGMTPVDAGWFSDADFAREQLTRARQIAARLVELEHLRDRQAQLVHNEKFAAVGLLAAEIAHEINNPATFVITNLTVMIDYVQTIGRFHDELRRRLADDEQVDLDILEDLETRHEIRFLGEDLDTLVKRSLTGLNRIHQIVQDLRYFSADRPHEVNWVDIEALVRAALNLVRHEARFRAEIVVDLPNLPAVRSDASRLSQVILNLLVNAVQSIAAGDLEHNTVRVTADVHPAEVVLVIADTGSGMSPDVLAQVFDPFFTTKDAGSGTGLGLSISQDIMRSLGGEIRATSKQDVGSRFEVVIPRGTVDE